MNVKERVGRYEQPPRRKPKIFGAQIKRQEDYRKMQDELAILKQYNAANETGRWNEVLDFKVHYHRASDALKQCKAEIQQAAKATIMIRRRALEVQLQKEEEQYSKELASLGKAFHKQRL